MRTRIHFWLQALTCSALVCLVSGCVTGMTVEHAEENDKPAFYALTPLTVTADTALLPVYTIWVIGVNPGWFPEH
jgi:hypothetical protein